MAISGLVLLANTLAAHAQNDVTFGALRVTQNSPCLSESLRREVRVTLDESRERVLSQHQLTIGPSLAASFAWPLRARPYTPSASDPGYHGVSNFVDHNVSFPGLLLDYNCGDRTYDEPLGYNHKGTDYFLHPFPWQKMENSEVEVVAAAAGYILAKSDGHFDRSCETAGGEWNAVYVLHVDGSEAWYGHLKQGSLTTKGVGEAVVQGEYLGAVGSSGNSNAPHLHLEVYDVAGNLIDPYAGACNALNAASWWATQRPYYDKGLNRISTHSAYVLWGECPELEIANTQTSFVPGATVYFYAFGRDGLMGDTYQCEVRQPDSTTWDSWTLTFPAPHEPAYYFAAVRTLPLSAPHGTWTYRVSYEGVVYEQKFHVGLPAFVWAWQGSGGLAAAADNSGGFVVSGYEGTTAYDANGTQAWSRPYSGRVAVDGSENLLVAGYFEDTVDLGGGPIASAGDLDVFLAKFDPAGTHQWSHGFGGLGTDYAAALAVDNAGSAYMTGSFWGTANFGGIPLVSAGGHDVFLAKYDATGAHQWSQRFGDNVDEFGLADYGKSASVDVAGHVVVSGQFDGTVDFGGGPLVSAGGTDIYVAKYSSTGAHLWSKRFGGPFHDIAECVAVDAASNVIITGSFSGSGDFGGGVLASLGVRDIYLAKYDAGGAHLWSKRFGGPGSDDRGGSVVTDAAGNVFLVGSFSIAADFGGGDLQSEGVTNAFIAKFDEAGVHQWSRSLGGPYHDHASAVAVNGSGRIALTGSFDRMADFGGGLFVSPGYDTFVAIFSDASATAIGDVPRSSRTRLDVVAYPNPFNPIVTIQYYVPYPASVTMRIYDARGRFVTGLLDNEWQHAGEHRSAWDGRGVASGIYFLHLTAGNAQSTRKIVLLK